MSNSSSTQEEGQPLPDSGDSDLNSQTADEINIKNGVGLIHDQAEALKQGAMQETAGGVQGEYSRACIPTSPPWLVLAPTTGLLATF
jgi:hypothetical protein